MTRRDQDLIEHILDAAGKLAEIVTADERASTPVGWCAAPPSVSSRSSAKPQASCPSNCRGAAQTCPITEARGMRNVIAHDYGEVDYDLLWHTISTSVPEFAAALGSEIEIHPFDTAEPEPPSNI